MLKLKDVHFSYAERKILQGLTFSAPKGELLALIGISGSGKTTLFRLISGLISPQKGEIMVDEKPLPQGALNITYMRQEDLLLPWRTVLENVLLLTEFGSSVESKKKRKERALVLLKKMGLEEKEDCFPKELSGGMRQRVALARALMHDRPLLLLDEPFASLDVLLREQLYGFLKEIKEQYNKTILMVTHDFRDALTLADRILILNSGIIVGDYALTPLERSSADFLDTIKAQLV